MFLLKVKIIDTYLTSCYTDFNKVRPDPQGGNRRIPRSIKAPRDLSLLEINRGKVVKKSNWGHSCRFVYFLCQGNGYVPGDAAYSNGFSGPGHSGGIDWFCGGELLYNGTEPGCQACG